MPDRIATAIQDALASAEVFIEYGGNGYGHVYIRFLEKTEYGLRLYANRRLEFDLIKCKLGKRTQLQDFEYRAMVRRHRADNFTAPSGGAPEARKSRRQEGKPTPANS